MIVSFMGFYLFEKLGQSMARSAFIATLGPLTGILCGTLASGLSDRYGRKPIMVAGISIQALAFFGYIFADNYFQFIGLSILGGLAPALYWPSANAQIADLIDEERRGEVYALMYSALNAGAAFGPLLGLAAYKFNPKLAFVLAGTGLMIYAGLLFFKTQKSAPILKTKSEKKTLRNKECGGQNTSPLKNFFTKRKSLFEGIVNNLVDKGIKLRVPSIPGASWAQANYNLQILNRGRN